MSKLEIEGKGPVRITARTIDAEWRRRRPGLRIVIRDAECRGLRLVVNPTGMSWVFSYKPRGADALTGKRWSTRDVTIGTPEAFGPDAARTEANRLKAETKRGHDPALANRARIAAQSEQRASTCDRLIDDYSKALKKRPSKRGDGTIGERHRRGELAQLKLALAEMSVGNTPIAAVSTADVRRLLAQHAERPVTARNRFGPLSRFFDWAVDAEHRPDNPCASISSSKRPPPVKPRQRVLSVGEVAALWRAADSLSAVHRDLARFLMAVPCRRSEAARLTWDQLDPELTIWTQPGAFTKNGDEHRFALPALAQTILSERRGSPRPRRGLVFAAPESGKAIDTFSDMKETVDESAGIKDWRWHDFRRAFASALGEEGLPESVLDGVLNHRQAATRGGVLGVYQRSSRWPEQNRAMERWNELLAAAIEGRQPGTDDRVLRLKRAS